MSRIVASQRALEAVVALNQRPAGLRLTDLAAILHSSPSSAQRALELLRAEGFVERSEQAASLHRLREGHPACKAFIAFALRSLQIEEALDLVCRSNPAIEFAGKDARGYLLVMQQLTDPADEARMLSALRTINADRADAQPVTRYRNDEVRDLLVNTPQLEARVARMQVIKGSVKRSFPSPCVRRQRGKPLGRLHPRLRRPSRRALVTLARRHHLARLVVFGSAVRTDFRDHSDVDVLIEPRAGTRLGVDDVLGIREELERAFERRVDLLNARFARPKVVEQAGVEGVTLYG